MAIAVFRNPLLPFELRCAVDTHGVSWVTRLIGRAFSAIKHIVCGDVDELRIEGLGRFGELRGGDRINHMGQLRLRFCFVYRCIGCGIDNHSGLDRRYDLGDNIRLA